MYIFNNGEIKTNKAITEEAKEIIESILGEENVCDVGESTIYIDEYCKSDFETVIANVIEEIKTLGYVLNGNIDYFGEYDGRVVIEDNNVTVMSEDECVINDAGDQELITELESRGYEVTIKGRNLTPLLINFIGVLEENGEDCRNILEDLREAGATDDDLEVIGYEDVMEFEED